MTTYYKVLNTDGSPCYGGAGAWHLPRGKRPGKWMPTIKDIEPCSRGYHLCRAEGLIDWAGPAIYVAEGRGQRIDLGWGGLVVFERARLLQPTCWDERAARLFAADCAEHVLPTFERECPGGPQRRRALENARAFSRGKIALQSLDAAGVAAVARVQARDAAGVAEREWQTRRLMRYLEVGA